MTNWVGGDVAHTCRRLPPQYRLIRPPEMWSTLAGERLSGADCGSRRGSGEARTRQTAIKKSSYITHTKTRAQGYELIN